MAATYDLTTEIGQVRRNISDKDIANPVYTDEEIRSFLDDVTDLSGVTRLYAVSANILVAWAASLARDDEQVRVGNWQGDTRDVVKKMLTLAEVYRKVAGVDGPVITRGVVFRRVCL